MTIEISGFKDMTEKLEQSKCSITIFSGKVDAKLCLELGAAVLLNKSIILLVLDGAEVSAKLRAVADDIITGDPMKDACVYADLQAAIQRAIEKPEGTNQ